MNELLEAAKPAVIESLKTELAKGISYEARQKCADMVRRHVEEWVVENILPEVTASMIESKDGLISVAVGLAPTVVDEIQKAVIVSVKNNLETSYKRKQIFDALLS